jgi:hypothetical protein
MTDAVHRVQPSDPEIEEEWLRDTDEPEIRGVEAFRNDASGGWLVGVRAMEFMRQDPLEGELRERIPQALRAVSGVVSAEEHDREKWFVTGTPSGKALAQAAARVVDDLADRTRAAMRFQ